uniref:Galectin n=1 Tax=Strongyloides venezuelensis TaxID=75913 RepID=A0A0K0FDV1_STRVS
MNTIHNPVVPLFEIIYEEFCPGVKIIVEGQVSEHHGNSQDFAIDLLSELHVVLHLNFRFSHGSHKEHNLVMNSCFNGSWGREIRYRNPLHDHDNFTIIIAVYESYYIFYVNGSYVGSFKHRIQYQTIQAIGVKGQVNIEKIKFEGFNFYNSWENEYDYEHSGY